MPWNANDASRQAAQRRAQQQQQQRSHQSNQQRAARQMNDLMAQYRSRKVPSCNSGACTSNRMASLYNRVKACRGLGRRSKDVLIAYIFIGVIAAVIVAMGSAVL
jgi:Flp pilus assembly protein TadB